MNTPRLTMTNGEARLNAPHGVLFSQARNLACDEASVRVRKDGRAELTLGERLVEFTPDEHTLEANDRPTRLRCIAEGKTAFTASCEILDGQPA